MAAKKAPKKIIAHIGDFRDEGQVPPGDDQPKKLSPYTAEDATIPHGEVQVVRVMESHLTQYFASKVLGHLTPKEITCKYFTALLQGIPRNAARGLLRELSEVKGSDCSKNASLWHTIGLNLGIPQTGEQVRAKIDARLPLDDNKQEITPLVAVASLHRLMKELPDNGGTLMNHPLLATQNLPVPAETLAAYHLHRSPLTKPKTRK